MARELNYTIGEIFRTELYSRGVYGSYYNRVSSLNFKKVYMSIPINKPVFEVPTFAFETFEDILKHNKFDVEAIIVTLNTTGSVPRYKTLNRYIRDVLLNNYYRNKLVELEVKGSDNTPLLYYATHGAIFNDEFYPIMLCSWQIERTKDEEGNYKYKFLRPILRIHPSCYLRRGDSMEKFIVNKLPLVALDTCIHQPYGCNLPECFGNTENLDVEAELKIEIDQCPFDLRVPDKPSISTTNEKLLQIAIDHIEDIS